MEAISTLDHQKYLRETIELAKKSPPQPSNFRVGCVIVSPVQGQAEILSTGYTLELSGNTHAEQCALRKLAQAFNVPEDDLSTVLTQQTSAVLYTSLEPCGKRLSGNLPCVQRIIATRTKNPEGGIRKVVFGAREPNTFVKDSQSCKLLTEAGIEWEYLAMYEDEILSVATEGHERHDSEIAVAQSKSDNDGQQETILTDREAAQIPRNPKKRMMEALPGSEESWL